MLGESLPFTDLVAEVAPGQVVHDEVEIWTVLEGVDHVNEEGVTKLT